MYTTTTITPKQEKSNNKLTKTTPSLKYKIPNQLMHICSQFNQYLAIFSNIEIHVIFNVYILQHM